MAAGIAQTETRFLNRELSQLDFNGRLLEVVEDDSVPLLDRVNFCSIFSSNMDEFFMVRVAGLMDQVAAGSRAAARTAPGSVCGGRRAKARRASTAR